MKEDYSGTVSVNEDAKSPFWMVSFVGADGKQKRRSTKVPVGGGMFKGERLSAAQAKKRALVVGLQIAGKVQEEYYEHDNRSVRSLFDVMLSGKLGRVSENTYDNARYDYAQFCRWLGKRAHEPARLITRADVREWVFARRAEVRYKTVKKALTAIRAAFAWAVDAEVLLRNPCDGVQVPPDSRDERIKHEAFTLEEVRVLVDKLPDEWSAAVRCCMGTYGQRLGDILSLRWEQFDWERRVVCFVTGKTGRALEQPMQEGFYAWARERYARAQELGGEDAVWVLPELKGLTNPSSEFTAYVRLLGIGKSTGRGVGRRNAWHSKTFHSLRATVATMLQAAGVAQGMAMQLVGHESADVHAVYIRPSAEQLRLAAQALPVV